MHNTENYSMNLPDYGDEADIAKLNANTVIIDDLIHGNRTMIAPAYDDTASYTPGDRVVYGGKYYKCTTATTGAWDASKWIRTTVGEDIEEVASAAPEIDYLTVQDGMICVRFEE